MKPDRTATLAIVNARIWTGNQGQPWAEAIAIEDHLITAVGSNRQIRRLTTEATQMVDAQNQFVSPGFIDSHVHLLAGGLELSSVQLRDCRTRAEFTAAIAQFARSLQPGEWITGGSWDHTLWGGELPTRHWIDQATPRNPVWIRRLDGHMALANRLALQLAGVKRQTPDLPGGTIVRDSDGEATGILKDNAMSLVSRIVPEPSPDAKDRALDAAMTYFNSHGVTSVQDMGTSWDTVERLEQARDTERLRTRVYCVTPLPNWDQLRDRIRKHGRGDHWVRLGGLKGFVDGSLGSHTAAFHDGYSDRPGDKGLLVNTPDNLHRWIQGADAAGLQVMVHAIGDRANTLLLDTYEQVIRENGPSLRRFRVEHAQHISPTDIPRFAQLGVIPSMQPYHAIDDGRWAEPLIGTERCQTTYAFRSLIDSGASPAFGSDWFVAPASPVDGIYAATTRRTLDDKNPNGWVPEQKISVEEALRAYTVSAAAAEFSEDIKGSLEPGKLADLVILNHDPTAIPSETLRDIKVVLTVVNGKVVYFGGTRATNEQPGPRL